MINQIIRLAQPKLFENVMVNSVVSTECLLIRPTYLSICHADQRYYQGKRSKEVLSEKLPMALIHEAIGEVQYDPLNQYSTGDQVVLVPNIPGYEMGMPKSKSVLNSKIGENYCPQGKFCSSGYDGFMQELVSQPRNLLVKLEKDMDSSLYSVTELVSVCVHAYKRFLHYSNGEQNSIGVWGDGNVAFLMALFIKYKMPSTKVTVFGKHSDKLEMFSFADATYLITESHLPPGIDHMFECVGGQAQSEVVNGIIDLVLPGASISLLGVSETNVEINIRKVLEKGIILIGNSRSSATDFIDSVEFIKNKNIRDYINMLITQQLTVRSIMDIHKAFEIDHVKTYGKTLMKWEL